MKTPFSDAFSAPSIVQLFSAERCAERYPFNLLNLYTFSAERLLNEAPACSVVQWILSLRREPLLNGVDGSRIKEMLR
jgi:hypothetical protein